MNRLASLLLLVVLSTAHSDAFGGSRVTGIYTDMRYNEEGGDLLGTEIFLLQGKSGYYVSFQSAQGVPETPLLVAAKVARNRLTFTLPSSKATYSGLFEGRIYSDRIEGHFTGGQLSPTGTKSFVLRKGQSYWQ